jgi:acyl carrier protein
MGPNGQKRAYSPAEQSKLLAISLLFGEEFLAKADPGLIEALQSSPQPWGELLIASWQATSTGDRRPPHHEPASPVAQTLPSSDAPPPDEAQPSPPQAPPQNGDLEPATPLAIFDPQRDPPVQTGAKKDCSREEIQEFLVNVIVEKTGYPPETFEESLDFEADLGIDSIKQVEAMSEVRQHFELSLDENFRMRDYPTLDAATDYIFRRLQGRPPSVESPQETAAP